MTHEPDLLPAVGEIRRKLLRCGSGLALAAALPGRARVVEPGSDEDDLARRLVAGKYQPTYGGDLSGWRRSALPVAVDLAGPAG